MYFFNFQAKRIEEQQLKMKEEFEREKELQRKKEEDVCILPYFKFRNFEIRKIEIKRTLVHYSLEHFAKY